MSVTIEPWTRCLAELFPVKPNDRVGRPIRREVYGVITEVMPLTWVENDADNNPAASASFSAAMTNGSVCQCPLSLLQNPFFRESKRNRMEHEYESEREPRSILQVPPLTISWSVSS